MDQLKPILVQLKTHGFWVGCALVFIASIVAWFMASGSLSSQTEDRIMEVASQYSTTDSLKRDGVEPGEGASGKYHPNDKTQEGMAQVIADSKRAAREGWRLQYSAQEKLFAWPTVLPQAARDKLRPLRPIEKYVSFPLPADADRSLLADRYRAVYRDFIGRRLPELADMIGANWQGADAAVTSGYGDDAPTVAPVGGMKEDDFVVEWNAANQELWQSKTTNFQGKNGNTNLDGTPSTLQVLYAQEDLWVLEALFGIIKETNGDADAHDLANIKTIDHIYVGKDAISPAGSVYVPSEGGAFGGDSYDDYGGEDDYGDEGGEDDYGDDYGGGGGGAYGSSDQTVDVGDDPAEGRYVDIDYQPVSAGTLRAGVTSISSSTAYLAVAKRIPVRMGFNMDERAVMKLLAACANSQPTLEVRQVRINRHTARDEGFGGSGGYGDDYGDDDSGEDDGDAYGMDTLAEIEEVENVYEVPVEIYGIIYIFNPVDEEMLHIDGEESAEPATETTEAADVVQTDPVDASSGT